MLTLREMMFYETGPQAKRFINTRNGMVELCKDIVRIAQARGEIRAGERYRRAGEVLYAVFQIELRRWLAARRSTVDIGLQGLKEALEIVITGLSTDRQRP
jgi:hypothetical protein